MNMKSRIGMFGLLAAMMAGGMNGPGVETRTQVRRKYVPYVPEPLPDSILNPVHPNGHKTEIVRFIIQMESFTASIELLVSGGSAKSLNKKRIVMGHELKTYVTKNKREDLEKFGQFEIKPIEI